MQTVSASPGRLCKPLLLSEKLDLLCHNQVYYVRQLINEKVSDRMRQIHMYFERVVRG